MRVQIRDYQNKARLLTQVLKNEGTEFVNDHADVLLIDFDGPVNPYPQMIQRAYEECAEIVLYSHGAPVITAWDGIWKPGPVTRMYLAQSEGQKIVMNSYGYPYPIKTIGWHYCELKPFQPIQNVKKVLFAPEHPLSGGYMLLQTREMIRKVYKTLLELPFQMTMRYIGDLYMLGLEKVPGVNYQRADTNMDESVRAIDDAEVVISYPGTFASLAIARGKPVVMYGQDIQPHDGYSDQTLKYVKHWEDYRQFMRYPYDISNKSHKAVEAVIRHAAVSEATEWRNRFIGEQLKSDVLMNTLMAL